MTLTLSVVGVVALMVSIRIILALVTLLRRNGGPVHSQVMAAGTGAGDPGGMG